MQETEARKLIELYEKVGQNKTRLSEVLGIDRSAARRRLNAALQMTGSAGSQDHDDKQPHKGISLKDLQEQHDPATRLRKTIDAELIRGFDPESPYLTEAQFRDRCGLGVATPAWKAAAQSAEYSKHKFIIDKVVFWTSTEARNTALRELTRAREYIGPNERR